MPHLVPLEYSFNYPYASVLCQDVDGKKMAFTADMSIGTPEEITELLDRQIQKYNEKLEDMQSAKDIRNMTMAEYAHYRRTYLAEDIPYALEQEYRASLGFVKSNPKPNMILSKNAYTIEPQKPPFTKPIEPANKPTAPKPFVATVQNYESSYWKFVNAKTQDEADAAIDSMLANVSMSLEPKSNGSWVNDPNPPKDENPPGWRILETAKNKIPVWATPLILSSLFSLGCLIYLVIH